MADTKKKTTSWGWIIFWFILFWPVGLILLFRKISSDKTAVFKESKTVTIVSFVLMGLGLLILFTAFSDGGGAYIYFWAFALMGGGVWVNRVAHKMKIEGERCKKYIALIVNQNQTSIDNIASAVGVTYEIAVKDLQKMIDNGYFIGANIDLAQRDIVLARPVPQQNSPTAAQAQGRIIACGSCGANNRVAIGQIAECEYCGSLLQ